MKLFRFVVASNVLGVTPKNKECVENLQVN